MLLRALLLLFVCSASFGEESEKCTRLLMRLNEYEGTLQYPLNEQYPPSAKCQWPLQASQGEKSVEISFKSMDIDGSPPSCRSDSLSVLSSTGSVLARYCGNTVPRAQRFPFGSVILEFSSNSEKEGAGFLLTYKFLQVPVDRQRVTTASPPLPIASSPPSGKCDPVQRSDDGSGRVHFIHPRTASYQCKWKMAPPSSVNTKASHMLLVFSKVDVGDEEDCHSSPLKVTWGESSSNPVCRKKSASTQLYTAESVTLEFTGSTSPQQTGFDVRFFFWSSADEGRSALRPFNMDFCSEAMCAPFTLPSALATPPIDSETETSSLSEPLQDSTGTAFDSFQDLKCGVQEVKPVLERIVGGSAAVSNSWPWMASVKVVDSDKHICGGTLITDQWVLSAAHCFREEKDPASLLLRFGAHNLRVPKAATEQLVKVDRIVPHQHYNARTHDNDVALLHLAQPVTLNTYVQPICLPREDEELTANGQFVITGWGEDNDSDQDQLEALRQVEVPSISETTCKLKYPLVTENMFCAGLQGGGKDSCQGDSGGPAQIQKENQYVQVGIVSFGVNCGVAGSPGVYTKLTKYVSWIHSVVGES